LTPKLRLGRADGSSIDQELPGMAGYFLLSRLTGFRDARMVVAHEQHPAAPPLSFFTKATMPVDELVSGWLFPGKQIPPLGAAMFAYLVSLEHRAEILGRPGSERDRLTVPDPANDQDGFRTATTEFFRLFHLRAGPAQDELVQDQINQARYYRRLLLDPYSGQGTGFPLVNGAAFSYTTLALPVESPLPNEDQQVKVSSGGKPFPAAWLMRHLGALCPPPEVPAV
jgi:hypothetical protein